MCILTHCVLQKVMFTVHHGCDITTYVPILV